MFFFILCCFCHTEFQVKFILLKRTGKFSNLEQSYGSVDLFVECEFFTNYTKYNRLRYKIKKKKKGLRKNNNKFKYFQQFYRISTMFSKVLFILLHFYNLSISTFFQPRVEKNVQFIKIYMNCSFCSLAYETIRTNNFAGKIMVAHFS